MLAEEVELAPTAPKAPKGATTGAVHVQVVPTGTVVGETGVKEKVLPEQIVVDKFGTEGTGFT